jgi:hypothetical protein
VDSATLASGTITNNLGVVRIDQAGGFGSLFLVDQRYEIMDRARLSYDQCIRSRMTFT